MKTIKELTVTVKYTVGLGNIQVPDDVYEALSKAYDNGGQLTDVELFKDNTLYTATEWLSDKIRERDAFDWEYEIELLEE